MMGITLGAFEGSVKWLIHEGGDRYGNYRDIARLTGMN